MTADGFRAQCIALINQLLTHGFTRPIAFAAIASDGLTTSGSSETVTGAIPLGMKTTTQGAFGLYLLPVHLLFVDAQGRVAHGIIECSGAASVRLLS